MDDKIRKPGKWLDEVTTDTEDNEFITCTNIIADLRRNGTTDPNTAADAMGPYMNSFMHVFYKMMASGNKYQLHATDDGIFIDNNKKLDIIGATIDFIGYCLNENNVITTNMQDIKLPDSTATPIDRITQMFFRGQIPFDTPVKISSGTRKKEKLAPTVQLSLLDLPPGIVLSRNITPFDNEVFRAVCDLQDAGNKHFTGHTIYKSMTKNPNAIATNDTLRMIDESWKRLTSVSMQIDTGNMGDAYGFKRWIRNRRVIEGGDDTMIVQNQHGLFQSTVYSITEEPMLKTYAAHLGQIGRYPAKWLNTPINKTPEMLIIQTALFDHIQAIPSISNHVVYDSLFDRVDIEAPNPAAERKKKSKLRNQIHKMLDYWKECGIIQSWHEEKKGNAIYCIVIDKTTTAKLPDNAQKKPLKKRGRPPKKTGTTP